MADILCKIVDYISMFCKVIFLALIHFQSIFRTIATCKLLKFIQCIEADMIQCSRKVPGVSYIRTVHYTTQIIQY